MLLSVRGLTRRAVKPLVMAVIAASLALSLTVTTTQKAEATPGVAVAPVIAAAESVLAGGVRLALPSLLSIAIATTPVGWFIGGGLAIGALAVGAYASRDYWVPFVTGAFGAPPEQNVPANNQYALTTPNLSMSGLVKFLSPQSREGVTSTVTYSGTATTGQYHVSQVLRCKKADNSVYNKTYTGVGAFTPGGKLVLSFACNDIGDTALDAQYAAHCAHTVTWIATACTTKYQTYGPANVVTYSSGQAFDPRGGDVKYKTTAECIDDGGNKSSITAEWFGDEGGAKIPSCAAAGKGHGTGKISIDGYAPTAPGVVGTSPKTIWDTQAPPADADHPLCGPNRPGPGCEMKITIDGKPCTVGAWDCENWTEIWKDPTTAPRVGCTYGPYTLAVDLCRVMEPAYRPGGAPATEENMDGNPQTRNYTNPGGTTYAPPATGTAGVPGVGGSPAPGTDPKSAECFPAGWAMLNPVEWVLQPIRCAFTPSPSTATNLTTRINTKISKVGFAPVADAWGAAFQSVGGGSGCAGPTVNFSMNGVHQQFQPFNACSGPIKTAAGVSTAVLSLGIVFFGGLGIVRAIGSAFGFNFSMGGKSDGD